jgi:hypothetical protein
VSIWVKPNEVEREVARHSVLGRYVEHSSYLTQDGFAIVLVLIAFDCHDPIGLVNEEVDPGELLRPLPTKRDNGFTVWGVADGCEVLVHSLLSFLLSLVSSFSVVPFDVLFQIVGLDVAGVTTLHGAHERTVVVVNHHVTNQICLLLERLTTARDIAMERPLSGVGPLVVRKDIRSPESGPTTRCIALVRPLTCMGPFMLGGCFWRHFFAALPEPAENLAVREFLPLWSPAFTKRGRWWWAGSL